MSIDSDNIGFVVVGLVILWLVLRSRRRARSPEGLHAAAQRDLERQEAMEGLPDGWSIFDADRERYGVGSGGVEAYGVVATGPAGERAVGLALTKTGAYEMAKRAIRGDVEETDAWAPPVADLATASVNANAHADVAMPMGWTLVMVDHESFSGGGPEVSTYGALAIGPGGQRALAVARDKPTAAQRLVDRIEGRLQVSDGWAVRLDAR